MKFLKLYICTILALLLNTPLMSQQTSVVPQRTPEQEATRQTEKFQKELNLSSEQTRQVYEINLKYARQRQISNTRSEAIERMKNKSTEIQRVLTPQQSERLQSKWIERTATTPTSNYRNPGTNSPASSSAFRSTSELRMNTGSRPSAQSGSRTSSTRGSAESGERQTPQTGSRGGYEYSRPSVSTPSSRSVSPSQSSQPSTRSSSSSSSSGAGSSTYRSESSQGSRR